jgi:nucleotide-binding universal stress UspA family protein
MTSNPTEFRHVLAATDFTDPANHAVDVALSLAEKFGGQVTLVHAYYIPAPAYDSLIAWPINEVAAGAQRALDAAVARAKQRYPKCEGVLQMGFPPECIVDVAKQRGADIIVMGTHGRRGVMHALLGSVAEHVVRTSPVPVLTVAPPHSK